MHLARRSYVALALFSAAAIAVAAIAIGSPMSFAGGQDDGEVTCTPPQGKVEKFADTKLFFEYNATDGDTGVQGLFDASGWSELCVYDPSGQLVLAVKPQSQLGDLGMGAIGFESREPAEDEVPQEEVLAAFPEGKYRVEGTSVEGTKLTGAATLTHDLPQAPAITFPEDGDVVDSADLVITWEPVAQTVFGGPVQITGYEVIVTDENVEDPHGFSQPILSAHVGPSVTSLTIPTEFLEPGTEYELEVLALERSGNQTISLLFFETE